MRLVRVLLLSVLAASAVTTAAPQLFTPAPGADPLHTPLDRILDTYVRDGMVYYRALRTERARLDKYAESLNVPQDTYRAWTPPQQMAFWVNAYNAFVLQTVIDHYPIHGRSADYPATSVRQIPGGFDQAKHRAAGRSVTLEEIEKTILPEFKDPRLYLALGRAALGSGRLRSEAYTAERLPTQLASIEREFVNDQQMLKVDRLNNRVSVTPIFSWREADFVAAYDKGAAGLYAQRSPIERAILAFIGPHLLPLEKELLQQNQFSIAFHQFDWTLNDLTGR
jgi:hypothetical protein